MDDESPREAAEAMAQDAMAMALESGKERER